MENVAKGRMVSEWLREKLPLLLGWVGLGNRDPRVGHASTPSTWGTAMASWSLATHWGCNLPVCGMEEEQEIGGLA